MPFGKPKLFQAIKKIGSTSGPKPEPAPARIEAKLEQRKNGGPEEDQTDDYGFDVDIARDVREFRQLLLELYKLNVYLSSLKKVYEANRADVEDTRLKAQAALKDLQSMALSWHQNSRAWDVEEYKMIEEIFTRVSQIVPVPTKYNSSSLPRR